jgi:hypothetical protein
MPNATDLVKVNTSEPGSSWFITLAGDGLPRVDLGTYMNPALAKSDADKIISFLTALLAHVRENSHPQVPPVEVRVADSPASTLRRRNRRSITAADRRA